MYYQEQRKLMLDQKQHLYNRLQQYEDQILFIFLIPKSRREVCILDTHPEDLNACMEIIQSKEMCGKLTLD